MVCMNASYCANIELYTVTCALKLTTCVNCMIRMICMNASYCANMELYAVTYSLKLIACPNCMICMICIICMNARCVAVPPLVGTYNMEASLHVLHQVSAVTTLRCACAIRDEARWGCRDGLCFS